MAIGYYEFTVSPADDGITLKSFLRRICGLSARSMKVIRYGGGSISRNGMELRAHHILNTGDIIKVRLPKEEQSDIVPIEGKLDILFEDDRLLIVNKPAYMPVHPTKIHQLDTLANIVMYYQQSRGESYPFRALNRLDKDTSGIVILAKDRIAYNMVFSQFVRGSSPGAVRSICRSAPHPTARSGVVPVRTAYRRSPIMSRYSPLGVTPYARFGSRPAGRTRSVVT